MHTQSKNYHPRSSPLFPPDGYPLPSLCEPRGRLYWKSYSRWQGGNEPCLRSIPDPVCRFTRLVRSMRQFAAPLKVSASSKLDTGDSGSGSGSSSTRVGNQPGTNAAPGSRAFAGASGASKAKGIGSATATSPLGPSKIEDISSPHELTAYVSHCPLFSLHI